MILIAAIECASSQKKIELGQHPDVHMIDSDDAEIKNRRDTAPAKRNSA